MMRRKTVAQYLDISEAELEREVNAGRLPLPVKLGKFDHWSQSAIDVAVERLTGEVAPDWRLTSKLYAPGFPPPGNSCDDLRDDPKRVLGIDRPWREVKPRKRK